MVYSTLSGRSYLSDLLILVFLVLNGMCFFLTGTGFDEEAALLGAGREFALMKTASGKVSDGLSEMFNSS